MIKKSIRLSLSDDLLDALDLLKRTRYPFMKDDEILKLAFSQLFASNVIISNKMTTVSNILTRIRSFIPDFGKEWLKINDFQEENMTLTELAEMIVYMTSKKATK